MVAGPTVSARHKHTEAASIPDKHVPVVMTSRAAHSVAFSDDGYVLGAEHVHALDWPRFKLEGPLSRKGRHAATSVSCFCNFCYFKGRDPTCSGA